MWFESSTFTQVTVVPALTVIVAGTKIIQPTLTVFGVLGAGGGGTSIAYAEKAAIAVINNARREYVFGKMTLLDLRN
jgi:hypothetical protein